VNVISITEECNYKYVTRLALMSVNIKISTLYADCANVLLFGTFASNLNSVVLVVIADHKLHW